MARTAINDVKRRRLAEMSADERAALRKAAMEEGAWLHMVENDRERSELVRLAAEAHTVQQADPAYRAELAEWTAVAEDRDDGVPARAGDYRPAAHERWVKRDYTGGQGRSTASTGIPFEQEPAIAVLTSYAFGPYADVAAGQAMQRVLLTATGTVGGLAFATWALLDLAALRWLTPIPAGGPWSVLAALPAAHCRAIEGCYFGGLSHLQITRVLGVAPA